MGDDEAPVPLAELRHSPNCLGPHVGSVVATLGHECLEVTAVGCGGGGVVAVSKRCLAGHGNARALEFC